MITRDFAYGKEDIEMKNKLVSNWGLKLISVMFAIILWLIVVNVDDPVTTKKFKNIPVQILSERLISDAGEIYEVLDKSDSVTVTVKAKRSVVEALSEEDFRATADIAERISENSIPIRVVVTKYTDKIADIYLQNNTVKISVEEKINKEIPVEIQLSGETADGYTVGTVSVNPQVIEITGPYSAVFGVEKVVVPVAVDGAVEDINLTAEGEYYGNNNNIIHNSRIEGNSSNIQVNVHLLHTKSIDLNLVTEGSPAADYWCQDIQYTPTTITIAGEPKDLEKINTLDIPASELNIAGAKENIVKEIDVTGYLPEGIIVCDGEEKKIKVTVVISALDGKEFKIPLSEVDILNTPSGVDTVLDETKTVSVIVKGSSEAINSLSINDIKISVDIKNKAVGVHNIQALVTVPNGYVVMNQPIVSIVLEQSGEVSSETPTSIPPIIPSDTIIQTTNPQSTPEIEPTETPTATTTVTPSETPAATVEATEEPEEEN